MHPEETPKILTIGLLLSEKAEYGRGVPRGVADFAKDHPHWRFRVETASAPRVIGDCF